MRCRCFFVCFFPTCPKNYFFAGCLFADPYKTGRFFEMVPTTLVKSSGTFLDVTSALNGKGGSWVLVSYCVSVKLRHRVVKYLTWVTYVGVRMLLIFILP